MFILLYLTEVHSKCAKLDDIIGNNIKYLDLCFGCWIRPIFQRGNYKQPCVILILPQCHCWIPMTNLFCYTLTTHFLWSFYLNSYCISTLCFLMTNKVIWLGTSWYYEDLKGTAGKTILHKLAGDTVLYSTAHLEHSITLCAWKFTGQWFLKITPIKHTGN